LRSQISDLKYQISESLNLAKIAFSVKAVVRDQTVQSSNFSLSACEAVANTR
jgi:hypothetical protein